jgi:cysteine desulfurase
MTPVYLDYNATTPIDPAVVEAMLPFLRNQFGNPSSAHAYGKSTHAAVVLSRSQVARSIACQADELVFTSGASEAINAALKGYARMRLCGGTEQSGHIVTSAVEHPATLRTCEFLERVGCKVTVLPVDRFGTVDPDAVRRAVTGPGALVSIMHANNEVGTVEPIEEISRIAHEREAMLHVDAAQTLGKIPVDVGNLGADLLSIAGHKVYAPKGVGALYVRSGIKLEPLIHGAGQEKGRRAGTENVPYIVGFGKACELAEQSLDQTSKKLLDLRNRLWAGLQAVLGERIQLNGHPERRLPNTLSVNFLGRQGTEILERAGGIAASTGSACHDGCVTLSPVLKAMSVPPEAGMGAVRLSAGRFTSEADIDRAIDELTRAAGAH